MDDDSAQLEAEWYDGFKSGYVTGFDAGAEQGREQGASDILFRLKVLVEDSYYSSYLEKIVEHLGGM